MFIRKRMAAVVFMLVLLAVFLVTAGCARNDNDGGGGESAALSEEEAGESPVQRAAGWFLAKADAEPEGLTPFKVITVLVFLAAVVVALVLFIGVPAAYSDHLRDTYGFQMFGFFGKAIIVVNCAYLIIAGMAQELTESWPVLSAIGPDGEFIGDEAVVKNGFYLILPLLALYLVYAAVKTKNIFHAVFATLIMTGAAYVGGLVGRTVAIIIFALIIARYFVAEMGRPAKWDKRNEQRYCPRCQKLLGPHEVCDCGFRIS